MLGIVFRIVEGFQIWGGGVKNGKLAYVSSQ